MLSIISCLLKLNINLVSLLSICSSAPTKFVVIIGLLNLFASPKVMQQPSYLDGCTYICYTPKKV